MKIEYEDFLGIYDNVCPDGYCDHVINEFERLKHTGAGTNRQKGEGVNSHFKSDHNIFFNLKNYSIEPFENENTTDIFFKSLQMCYDDYCERFSVLKDHHINCSTIKVQKSNPGEGYHIWHSERSSEESNRVLTYILYLNTLDNDSGGETELLYQRKRIRSIQNRMIICPADYTYTHRGNLVLGNIPKYIATGWFYYVN